MVAVAVNVTIVPGHTEVPGFAVMLTLTGKIGFTVIVITFDVAGLPEAHVAFDVSTQVIKSASANVDEV